MNEKIVNFSKHVPLTVADDRVVTLQYALYDADDKLLEYRDELAYLHGGYEKHLSGLQSVLDGLSVGDKREVVLEPEQAFGVKDPNLVVTLDKAELPEEAHQLWMKVIGESPDGNEYEFTVVDIDEEQLTLDANHPFAGKQLKFIVEVKGVREAKAHELEQGHVDTQLSL